MSTIGLDVFERSAQATHIWLNEITEQIGPDRKLAWHVLSVVLRVLRDRLQPEDAAHLAAQLPLFVRGAFYDQYRPSQQPLALRTQDEFVQRIQDTLGNVRPVNPAAAAKAVFAVLQHHLDPGEIAKVRHALPEGIRALWPAQKSAGDVTEERRLRH
ncbi:hypothetical protein FG93_06072 [Bosea sp. LC85]|uniref:DUF2267 domain-containing protein n=1 Tax=Bosea sp. LC85 TaxID=1502851 RepID=UPI0004E380FD|nr:DUF2267 domain-containing protein [Bosea sp. LC85]KFC62372.1 hypothetical protein FG93_06072 [Bosea sp. LC85]